MSDFETNLRSVEIALRHLPNGISGWAKLEPYGIKIHITNGGFPDDRAIDRAVAWHEFASWHAPMGSSIIQTMVDAINKPGKVMP